MDEISGEDHLNRALILFNLEKLDEALAEFEAIIKLQPNHPKAYAGAALIYSTQKSLDTAAEYCERALQLDANCAWVYCALGNICLRKNEIAEALVNYYKAIELDPLLAWPHNYIAKVCVSKDEQAEALKEYQEAIRLAPDWAAVHADLARLHENQNHLDYAIAEYQLAADKAPDWDHPHYCLGVIYWRQSKLDQSSLAYQRAIQIRPDWSWPHFGLALVYKAQSRVEDSILELRRTVALDPAWPLPYRVLGELYEQQAKKKQAIDSFRLALKLNDPAEVEIQRTIAWRLCMAWLIPFKSWAMSTAVWIWPLLCFFLWVPFIVLELFNTSGYFWGSYFGLVWRWAPSFVVLGLVIGWIGTALLSRYRPKRWNTNWELSVLIGSLLLFSQQGWLTPIVFMLLASYAPSNTGIVGVLSALEMLFAAVMLLVTHEAREEEGGIIYLLPMGIAYLLLTNGFSFVGRELTAFIPADILMNGELGGLVISVSLLIILIAINMGIARLATYLRTSLMDRVAQHYQKLE